MRPLPLQEREYREGLLRLERRAIIPLKWCILAITLLVWIGIVGAARPAHPVLGIFVFYGVTTAFETYWFYFRKITLAQIRPLTLVSFLADLIFVTILIYLDLATSYFGPETHNNFYVLYFLLVMRGFAMFRTIGETVFVNLLISALFILINYLQRPTETLLRPDFAQSLILIWLVILMTWFIINVINRQKLELMEVHDRLVRAESLARVGMLASGVAHEINNPIGIIATTAEYLRRYRPEDPEEYEEEIGAIQREAMRCKEIVQQMLTYARPHSGGKVPVDLRAVNDEVLAFVFPRNRTGNIELATDYDEKLPLAELDPNLVKQALLNLYLNARQAIAEGEAGRIVARIRLARQGRLIRIEIEDNGPGIAEDDLDHIFEPFFTRKAKGTGLGLAVTQRIIESMGGAVAVESAQPHGAIFVVEFPALPH